MIYDIQNASLWRRLSAWLLDFIVLLILTTGFAFVMSLITNYSHYDEELHNYYAQYEEEYNAKIDITSSELEELPEEDQARYKEMFEALNNDKEVLYVYNMTINLMMVIVSVGLFCAIMISEFVVPLILKNGQTIGKKVFALGVVKVNAVRISHLQLFVRTLLGKFAIERMIPVILIILLLFGQGNVFHVIVLAGLAIFQTILSIMSKYHQAIHDILAYTVVVDLQTQMIFDNENELLEYKKQNHLSTV